MFLNQVATLAVNAETAVLLHNAHSPQAHVLSGKKQGSLTLLPGFTAFNPWMEMPSIVRPRDIRGVRSAADSNSVRLVSRDDGFGDKYTGLRV